MSAFARSVLEPLLAGTANLAVLAAVAPVLDAVRGAAAAWTEHPFPGIGRRHPASSLDLGWTALSRLAARPAARFDGAGPVFRDAPAASLAASLAVLPLLPGPVLSPGIGRVADLPTLLVLLMLGRVAVLVGALASGRGAETLRAHAALLDLARAAIGLAAVLLTLFLLAGEIGLDQAAVFLRGGAPGRREAAALLGAALATALLCAGTALPDNEWSGTDLASCRYARMLRDAGWIELVSAVALPGWLAAPGATAGGWELALLGWPVRLLFGAAILGMVQRAAARSGRRRGLLGASVLLSVLAVLAGGTTLSAGTE